MKGDIFAVLIANGLAECASIPEALFQMGDELCPFTFRLGIHVALPMRF